MKIDNVKDLKKLITLCRTMGVEAIEVDGVKMNLGPTPVIVAAKKREKFAANDTVVAAHAPGGITEDIRIPVTHNEMPPGITDEELLFYSAGQSN